MPFVQILNADKQCGFSVLRLAGVVARRSRSRLPATTWFPLRPRPRLRCSSRSARKKTLEANAAIKQKRPPFLEPLCDVASLGGLAGACGTVVLFSEGNAGLGGRDLSYKPTSCLKCVLPIHLRDLDMHHIP